MMISRPKSLLHLNRTVDALEIEMMKHEQVDCPVIHRFSPGQYIREVHLPAGAVVIGHHQNFEHLNIFLKGRVLMREEDGTLNEMAAPMIFTGKPGRKVGYILEDVVWLNVFVTDETDIDALESHFLTKSDAWIESKAAQDCVLQIQSGVDRLDFESMIQELGLSAEMVREQSENESDQIPFPFGGYKVKVSESKIEGRGLFATAEIELGEGIAEARIDGKRTPAGRFTNHSANPNARMFRIGSSGDIALVAIKKISGCKGGLDGEEITINYRESYALAQEIGRDEICQALRPQL